MNCDSKRIPFLVQVKSLADVNSTRQSKCARELNLQLMLRGVILGTGFFLYNDAMTVEDMDETIAALKESLYALAADGML